MHDFTVPQQQQYLVGVPGTASAGPGSTDFSPGSTLADAFVLPDVVEVDLEDGSMLRYGKAGTDDWRVARVQTYAVPRATQELDSPAGPSKVFTRDYRHYKYHGFAGKGAKTSWAHNPKYNLIYEEDPVHYRVATLYLQSSAASSSGSEQNKAAATTVLRKPLRETMDGPFSRYLTPCEKLLIRDFRYHSWSSEGLPSVDDKERKGGGWNAKVQSPHGGIAAQRASPVFTAPRPQTAGTLSASRLQRARRRGPEEADALRWGMHDNMYGSYVYDERL